MGGNQSYQFDEKLFNSQWERKQGSSFDGRTIWISKTQPNKEIQEYPIYADTEEQINLQRDLFSLRKDSAQLVSATHLKQTVRGGLCSSSAQGRLFLQKIPLKLEALQHIPFPDILHVHFNSLTGYKRLNKAVGPFRPGSEQIGFNNQGQAKVWLNNDFSASAPSSIEISQVAMVRNLLQIIQDVTDLATTPQENPSIINYIYRNSNDVNFDQALNSIKDFANLYNGGVIPKNLECLQKVGIENISKSIITPREESVNSRYFQNQRSNLNSNGVYQQQNIANQQPPANQYRPVQFAQPIVGNNTPVYQGSQFSQQNVATYRPSQQVQFIQQPIQVVQQPIQAVQPTQLPQISQPGQILGTSGVRTQNVNFNSVNFQSQSQSQQKLLQSHVQTVRPNQQVFIRPQQQRVIQQVIRSPQPPVQVVPQPQSQIIGEAVVTTSLNQGSRINQPQNFVNQVAIAQQVGNQIPSVHQDFPQNQHQLNFQSNTPEVPTFSSTNKQSQVQILNQLQKQTSRQSEVYQLSQENRQNLGSSSERYETQFVSRNRNFIDSNTMSIGIDRANSQQLQSYSTSPQKSEVQKNFNLGSSKFNDISLQDGKSSQALLAQLRGFTSSSRKEVPTYNAYDYSSSSYNYTSSNANTNYEFTSTSYTAQSITDQPEDLYATFNKYAKGNNKWEENIQMKYSMAKNLYDQPTTSAVQYEQTAFNAEFNPLQGQYSYKQDIEKFQQQGEYHVDYDPQILADIQKLKN